MNALKWFVIAALVATGVVGNLSFPSYALGYRVLGILTLAVAAFAVFYTTLEGQKTWQFGREARVELRKVIWPTRTETLRMTGTVLLMVVVVGLFLWCVDALAFRLIAWLTGLSA